MIGRVSPPRQLNLSSNLRRISLDLGRVSRLWPESSAYNVIPRRYRIQRGTSIPSGEPAVGGVQVGEGGGHGAERAEAPREVAGDEEETNLPMRRV